MKDKEEQNKGGVTEGLFEAVSYVKYHYRVDTGKMNQCMDKCYIKGGIGVGSAMCRKCKHCISSSKLLSLGSKPREDWIICERYQEALNMKEEK